MAEGRYTAVSPGDRWSPNEVELVPWNERWPGEFAREAEVVRGVVGAIVVEHIGSTAVPGCMGKPVIDIIAVVDRVLPEMAERLAELGYVFRRETADPNHLFVGRGEPRIFHVHVLTGDHPYRRITVLLRDYLRAHPEAVRSYGELKRRALAINRDGFEYYKNKSEGVAALLARAEDWDARGRPDSEGG